MATWTTEQVLALAPDPNSAKNGKSLAISNKWGKVGQNETIIWGECQGSGKDPYRTQIDLTEPAFRCSCPSRKFPCKHGLGLFLLLVGEPSFISVSEPPDWVTEWLASRAKREEKQKQKLEQASSVADPVAQAKRSQDRLNKVANGVQELQLWLRDLIRQGLTSVQSESYQFWEKPAARAVDAQAPGLARHLREISSIPNSGAGWIERLLPRLGKLHLLLEGFQRLETLPVVVQADLRTQIGWTQNQAELLTANADTNIVRDTWLVVGQQVEEEDRLLVSRTWLWGQSSDRAALILQFTRGNQSFELNLPAGTSLEAELVFFESGYPLRALIKTRHDSPLPIPDMRGYKSVETAIASYGRALTGNPWLERFPMAIQTVLPVYDKVGWLVRDRQGYILPISPRFNRGWLLLALSGGHPMTLFGEWNGSYFFPLSAWVDRQFYAL